MENYEKEIKKIQAEVDRIKEGIEVKIDGFGLVQPYGFRINDKNEIKARDEDSFFVILLSEDGTPAQTLVVFPKIEDWDILWTEGDRIEGPIPVP